MDFGLLFHSFLHYFISWFIFSMLPFFLLLNLLLAESFCKCLYQVKEFLSVPSLSSFFMKRVFDFVRCFSCIFWDDHMIFVLYSFNMVCYSDFFLYVKPTLHSWANWLLNNLFICCWISFANMSIHCQVCVFNSFI